MSGKKNNTAANQKSGKLTTFNVPGNVRVNESTVKHRELVNVRDSVRPPKGSGTRR